MHPLLAHKSLIVPPQQRAEVVLPQIARGVRTTMVNVLEIKSPAGIVSETPNIVPLKEPATTSMAVTATAAQVINNAISVGLDGGVLALKEWNRAHLMGPM